jgi:hypothetical protein
MPPEPLNLQQQALADASCPTPGYLSTLAEQTAFAAGVAAMRREALQLTATPIIAMPRELSTAMASAWSAAEYTFTYPGEDHPGMKYVMQHQYRAMRAALQAELAARAAAGEPTPLEADSLAMPEDITDEMAEAWRAAKYTFTYPGEDHPGMKYVWEHQYRAMREVVAQDAERAEQRHQAQLQVQQEVREDAAEQAEQALLTYGRNPESDKLFAAIHANKHAFTAEAAHKAFAGVRRRRALPTLPPMLKIEASRELGALLDKLRQAGTLDTDPKGLLAARREVLNFIRQLMHDYAQLALAAQEAERAAVSAAPVVPEGPESPASPAETPDPS